MKEFIQLMEALLGSLGFAALFNIRGKKLIFATIGGFLSWATYLAAVCINANPYFCGFISTVLTTLYAEVMARMVKTPVTVFLVSATIPLIPGAALYRAMNCLMHRNYAGFSKEGTYTLLFAASMSAGITFTTVVFRMIWRQLYSSRSIHIR